MSCNNILYNHSSYISYNYIFILKHWDWNITARTSKLLSCKLYTVHTVHCHSNTHHFNQHMHYYYTLLCYTFLDYNEAHQTRQDSSDRLIGTSQLPLSDNTQQSQETGIHTASRIRTRNPTSDRAVNTRLRPRGHWGPRFIATGSEYQKSSCP